jgi:hypothetical protein
LVKGIRKALNTPPLTNPIPPPTAAVKSAARSATALRKASPAPSVAASSIDSGGATVDKDATDDGGSKASAKRSSSNDGGSAKGRAAKASNDD